MLSYEQRFTNALRKEHSKLINLEKGELYPNVVEKFNCCPVCNSKEYEIYCVKDFFLHKRCAKCSFVYLDPRLNQEATVSFYNSEVNEIYNETKFHSLDHSTADDVENLKNYGLLKKYIKEPKGKKLLEIGPGKGTFLSKATSEGFETHAIELNSLLIQRLKKITPNIYEQDILELDLPENYFDAIYFRDVMEHIPSVIPFLSKIHKILKPGGILLIDTHNIDSIVNSMTKEYHTVIFAFEHPVHWSPKTLRLAGEKAGFKYKEVFFDHEYQSIENILTYLLHPSFTFINPPQSSKIRTFILKKLLRIIQIKYLRPLDIRFMKWVSKVLKKGAKMQVCFTK